MYPINKFLVQASFATAILAAAMFLSGILAWAKGTSLFHFILIDSLLERSSGLCFISLLLGLLAAITSKFSGEQSTSLVRYAFVCMSFAVIIFVAIAVFKTD